MNYLLIGPQASGKGTQANLLAKKLNIPHFSSGDMLRAEKKSGSELGQAIAHLIDNGVLVPDEMIWKMIKKQLDAHPEGWILDGFPRKQSQAEMLDKTHTPDIVILLEVPDKVCIERISGRRICSKCGKEYHITYKAPKETGRCDLDGGELVQREDDTVEITKKRLADYHAQTKPLVEYYGNKVVKVNGDQSIQEVWKELQKALHI